MSYSNLVSYSSTYSSMNEIRKSKTLSDEETSPCHQQRMNTEPVVIGPVECPTCGMVYDMGDFADETRHTVYHNRYDIKYEV